ncbi:chemotaxis protein [Robbsia andropogonis]|uniref:Chemotaxis protein n=1 Tax=Robbsia andropogonis TaxID=28092 RepID=A0A0F5JZT3_9BURK|nr:methyl-accepting chemotaxis protein [Robbsia andropogonis]KKB63396.1 chemotaxis protein [Robbsia andropogonis]MCP1120699.1 methyl-accepting chemotaxis protein [Robbsia andropogonis]MCP1130433.1 methyl-accepting chemotaxis protein [Robbsia andropogonis]
MKLLNFRIGVRLGLAFALVVFLLIAVALLGTQHLNDNTEKMNSVIDEHYQLIALSNKIKSNGDRASNILSNLLLSSSAEQSRKYMDQYAQIREANASAYAKFEKLPQDAESKALYQQQFTARSAYGQAVRDFFALVKDGNIPEARDLYQGRMAELQASYYALVDKMVDYQSAQMSRNVADANTESQGAQLQMVFLSIGAIVLASVISVYITRSITVPVQRAVQLVEDVAAGNLTCKVEVTSNDEIGRLLTAFGQMVRNLNAIVSKVRLSTDTIAGASSEVAAGNMDLANRTEQQASALEQTAAAIEQLTATVKQNADRAKQANMMAESASEVAAQGGGAVERVVQTMTGINTSSRRIADIIGVIDEIAFQTNILALNAAVEAARAGEHGRGFAVVASEVRGLAQRSAVAAKEIKELIGESVEQVEQGGKMVGDAGQTILRIVDSIKSVTDVVSEITLSSREQSEGLEQINQAIAQVDHATQENAALVEESAAASRSMQDQAGELAELVSAFRLDETGAAGASPTAGAAAFNALPNAGHRAVLAGV